MAKLERWGKPYRDTRDWREYNEQLVKRGTLYLSLEFVEQWDQLVDHLNRVKHGQPFIYPGQFIQWMACIHSIFQITNEHVSDGEVFPALLDQLQKAAGDQLITQVLADGDNDQKGIFNVLKKTTSIPA